MEAEVSNFEQEVPGGLGRTGQLRRGWPPPAHRPGPLCPAIPMASFMAEVPTDAEQKRWNRLHVKRRDEMAEVVTRRAVRCETNDFSGCTEWEKTTHGARRMCSSAAGLSKHGRRVDCCAGPCASLGSELDGQNNTSDVDGLSGGKIPPLSSRENTHGLNMT